MSLFDISQVSLNLGKETILTAIDLTIQEGDWVTLVGPSGSGKSSLLKLLAGLTSPTSGQITFSGTNLKDLDLVTYRREVSYFFQQAVLFGDTVEDNLAFPFAIRDQAFDRERAIAGLAKVNLSPDDLTKKVRELSGGEKQRVAVVRNLLFEPKVLLLDEITTGLDAQTKQLVRQLIADYHASGKTIIEVTHDAQEIAEAKTIVNIVGGRRVNEH